MKPLAEPIGPVVPLVGDFNGDSKPDNAVADFGDNSVKIFLNNGAGVFNVQTYLSGNGG